MRNVIAEKYQLLRSVCSSNKDNVLVFYIETWDMRSYFVKMVTGIEILYRKSSKAVFEIKTRTESSDELKLLNHRTRSPFPTGRILHTVICEYNAKILITEIYSTRLSPAVWKKVSKNNYSNHGGQEECA
jgi:hypothetical protein